MHLPSADEADILRLGARIAPTTAQGVPRPPRHWRAKARASLNAFVSWKADPKAHGFVVALGEGLAVLSTWTGDALSELEQRLGELPTTAVSRCGSMTLRWYHAPPLPCATLAHKVGLRAGLESAPLPPALNQQAQRWRWSKRPTDVGVAMLPQTYVEETRRLALTTAQAA